MSQCARIRELVDTLWSAYRIKENETEIVSKEIYHEALKNLDEDKLHEAIFNCIRHEEELPTVVTILKYYAREIYIDWGIEWVLYLNDAAHKPNDPAQHTINVLTPAYIKNMIDNKNGGKVAFEFKNIYEEYCLSNMEC
jgi:hypothetical protein